MANGGHGPDTFKLPNHPTFSEESVHSTPEKSGGRWQQGDEDRWYFHPSEHNLKNKSPEELGEYLLIKKRKDPFGITNRGTY